MVGFWCLQPTNEAGRRGVNFLMNEEGRSQSHSWGVVAPGRARRPSASEVMTLARGRRGEPAGRPPR